MPAKKGANTPTKSANYDAEMRMAPKSQYSDRGGAGDNRRHWIVAILMQIGIRIRYIFESWCGILPIFHDLAEYPSPWRPKTCPQYDVVTRIGFMYIWIMSAFSREIAIFYVIFAKIGVLSLLNMLHDWLSNRLIAQFKAAGHTPDASEVPIPEYDWKNGSPDEFYETFVRRPHPVILRGFMKNTQLLRDLGWDHVLNTYGEEDVYLTKKELDGYPGKLKEVNDNSVYLHNSEVLFNKYPGIRDLFEYERLEPYLKMKPGYEQIFVGKKGTGTPFHNASVYNMFYMIDGTKKWYFVDPYDTWLAYPITLLGKAASVLYVLWPIEYNVEAFPMFKYCPIYTAEVGPGDVLFNPPWWWHSIKNTSEHSVAVASRWHTDGICGQTLMTTEENYDIYRWGSFAFFNGIASWGFLHSILQTPSPRYDEHITIREKNNRFVHKQIEHAEKGGIDMFGVKTKY